MSGLGAAMAGGNSQRGRQMRDHYPTPSDVTLALLRRYPMITRMQVWEPCAGDGAMADVLQSWGCRVLRSDIDPIGEGGGERLDFLGDHPSWARQVDAIVTNPPFGIAEAVIKRALACRPAFLALVLKSTFWHAARRRELWRWHQPDAIHPLTWRPDFLGLGGPTMEVMWCCWHPFTRRHDAPPSHTLYEPLSRT